MELEPFYFYQRQLVRASSRLDFKHPVLAIPSKNKYSPWKLHIEYSKAMEGTHICKYILDWQFPN